MIVVDFECTCEKDRRDYPNEIIEFPAILIDVRNGAKIVKEKSFRSYAKPWRNPQLTSFCTELTGISQQHVEKAPDLQTVVKNFEAWYRRNIPLGAKVMMMTDGPWDFRNFVLAGAVKRDHVAFPTLMYEYIDVRTTFANYFNKGKPVKLEKMLHRFNLRFEGREHCGFDDAVNIARLAVAMMRHGCIFSFVIALPLDEDTYHYKMDVTPLYRREAGNSGVVEKSHVEERAKECFGEAYYEYGRSTFVKKAEDEASDDADAPEVEAVMKEAEEALAKLEVVSSDSEAEEGAPALTEEELLAQKERREKRIARRRSRNQQEAKIYDRRSEDLKKAEESKALRKTRSKKSPSQKLLQMATANSWIVVAAILPILLYLVAKFFL
eukprot:GILJ01015082.1.p1 GENE.GILJ01015082.1~~GILJ01015082.1.p1  ORF type:complete len:381 (-),score=84.06 GILJ01015082.1:58-1200(-)